MIEEIFKNSKHDLSLFSRQAIKDLENAVSKDAKGYVVRCYIRDKDIRLKPEEVVRQLFVRQIVQKQGYSKNQIRVEYPVPMGIQKKSADIAILEGDVVRTIVETKKPDWKDGKEQLKSYCNATGATIAVWTNGGQISYYHRRDPNYFEEIGGMPKADESLEEFLQIPFTLKDLIVRDKIANEGKTLKQVILEIEDEVLANSGEDSFEEVFKLIFSKLYDEWKSRSDNILIQDHLEKMSASDRGDYEKEKEHLKKIDHSKKRRLEFRNTGQPENEIRQKVRKLFDEAKKKWQGIFKGDDNINLTDSHLAICVSSLQDVKLFNSNLIVIDEAFEYLVKKTAKEEKGQYFTPRHVIDMCVKMLNPKRGEYMIDPASGSCGFPMHTMFYMMGSLFENKNISEEDRESVFKIFGIDFEEKAVRVARTLNLIAGDGQSNVLKLNTLDYDNWKNYTEKQDWRIYDEGFRRLEQLAVKEEGENKKFNFDILMANPPFAGDIKEIKILERYEIANPKGKLANKVGRDILFIERNLQFLKPGGRMAIVLPQGRFNNAKDAHIRNFIATHARILAVVGLHSNTFKPHTGAKTSVLFLQKWNDNPNVGPLCSYKEDYSIFLAVSYKGGKDNSGEYILLRDALGKLKLDKHHHLVVDHDLHNHNGLLNDGVAEKFVEFAKSENFSFWKEN